MMLLENIIVYPISSHRISVWGDYSRLGKSYYDLDRESNSSSLDNTHFSLFHLSGAHWSSIYKKTEGNFLWYKNKSYSCDRIFVLMMTGGLCVGKLFDPINLSVAKY